MNGNLMLLKGGNLADAMSHVDITFSVIHP